MRQRQSSVICATQLPVTSTCAAARGERGGCGGPGGCAEAANANIEHTVETAAHHDRNEIMDTSTTPPEAARYRPGAQRLKSHLRMPAIGARDFPRALNYGLVANRGEAMIQRFCASMLACTVVTAAAAQAPAPAPA